MQNKSKSTKARSAFNKTLATPVPYSYSWKEYETDEELIAAKDEMTLEEQRKARNTDAAANARTKALNAALLAAGIVRPTAENDDQVRLADLFKTLMTAKKNGEPMYTVEKARELASSMAGVEWADEEE